MASERRKELDRARLIERMRAAGRLHVKMFMAVQAELNLTARAQQVEALVLNYQPSPEDLVKLEEGLKEVDERRAKKAAQPQKRYYGRRPYGKNYDNYADPIAEIKMDMDERW